MAAPDMSGFLAAFQFGTVIGAVLSVSAGLAGLYVVAKAVCFVVRMLTEKDICGIEGVAADAGDDRPPRPRAPSTSVKTGSAGRFKC